MEVDYTWRLEADRTRHKMYSYSFLTMTTNKFATEPQTQVIKTNYYHDAEELNGRLAMIGIVAALGSYILTGQIIPGIF